MYILEQKQVAIENYFKLRNHRKTIRILGYPGLRNTLKLWIREYKSNGKFNEPQYKRKTSKYSDERIKIAVEPWLNNGMNVANTCKEQGYPSRNVLAKWLDKFVVNT